MNRRLLGRWAAAAIGAGVLALALPGPAYASTAAVTPPSVRPGGTITVRVTCDGAANETIEALWGLASGSSQPSGTGSITLANGTGSVNFNIPSNTAQGSYSAGAFCPGDTQATLGNFTVSPAGAPAGGTGLEADGTALALAGAGALAAAGAAGGLLLIRRRADAPVA